MPRLTRKIPSYRKHSTRNVAIVEINGRRITLGRYNSRESRIKYNGIIAEYLTQRDEPLEDIPTCDVLMVDLCARWMKHARAHYQRDGESTGTAENYQQLIRRLMAFHEKLPVNDFGPKKLKAFRDTLIAEGHSRRYINDNIDRIKRMFRWGVAEELVHPLAFQALTAVPGLQKGRSPARETKPVEPVPHEVVIATLAHMPDVPADMVRLQLLTGARPGEVCRMRPCDVDTTGDVWIYTPDGHKTEHHGKERHVLIGPQGQQILRPYMLREATTHCFAPWESEKRRNAERSAKRVTPLKYGNKPKQRTQMHGLKYNKDAYRRAIQRACEKAFPAPDGLVGDELKEWRTRHRWSPNQLRHTKATEIRKEFGIEAAQVILGHSRLNTTEIYAEKNLELAKQVAGKVG